MTRLKIGLSACFFHRDPERKIFKGKTLLYLEESMAHWVMSHGALAYLIPSVANQSVIDLEDLVHELDGLVLQGGSDVCPKSYGEEALSPDWQGDFIRDQYEIRLVQEFLAQNKPILGVCRGAQLINVAFGGTLYQDIPTHFPETTHHRNWEIYDQNFHEIQIEPKSSFAKLYPNISRAKINSIHHQALKDIGRGLTVEATSSPDHLPEAIRAEGDRYVVGVQWHPEFQNKEDPTLLSGTPLIEEFLREAQQRKN